MSKQLNLQFIMCKNWLFILVISATNYMGIDIQKQYAWISLLMCFKSV